jgi:hypothetical protein
MSYLFNIMVTVCVLFSKTLRKVLIRIFLLSFRFLPVTGRNAKTQVFDSPLVMLEHYIPGNSLYILSTAFMAL